MNRTRISVLAIVVVATAVLVMLQPRHRQRFESAESSRLPATMDAAEVALANPSTADDDARTARAARRPGSFRVEFARLGTSLG